jgi:hypothetical protein
MGNFNNPWGKGSDGHDRWFKNPWKHDNDNEFIETETFPTIDHWEIKTSGSTSEDNNCLVCPKSLGINAADFSIGIELKAFIAKHRDVFLYNIRRHATLIFWENSAKDGWVKKEYPTYIDDRVNTDEMLRPQTSDQTENADKLYYIYVEDSPKPIIPPNQIADATAVVIITNMEEFVAMKSTKTDSVIQDPNTQKWNTRMYLSLSGGEWTMDAGKSSLGPGFANTDTPTD